MVMKKRFCNTIVIVSSLVLIGVICSAYFLLCKKMPISLSGFLFCAGAVALSAASLLVSFSTKSADGTFGYIGTITVSSIYNITAVLLWVISPLFATNLKIFLFTEIVVAALYIVLSAVVLVFSYHNADTEQTEETNLQTYTLCSSLLQELSFYDINDDIKKRIFAVSEQLRLIKSADNTVSSQIVAKVLSVQEMVKKGIYDETFEQRISSLELAVKQYAAGVKI